MRNEEFENSEEFRFFEENFDKILKEIDAERENPLYQMPEEWDQGFRQTIADVFEEKKKARRKQRFYRMGKIAAALVVVFLGVNIFTEKVQGENLVEMFVNVFTQNGTRYVIAETESVDMETNEDEEIEVYFSAVDLVGLQNKIREKVRKDFFSVRELSFPYDIKRAKYNVIYRVINIELETTDGSVFFTQENKVKEVGSGHVEDLEVCAMVENENLEQEIEIYHGVQSGWYVFSVQMGNQLFACDAVGITLEMCIEIAENLVYE